jgi:hypothetical protein
MHSQRESSSNLWKRLFIEETAESKAQVLACLNTLKVWGTTSIEIRHKVGDVLGAAETGNVVFDDADDTKLDIYVSLNGSEKAMIDFELCEAFVRYCGIADSKLAKLISPILTYPLEAIDQFLEQHGLDSLEEEFETAIPLLEESDEENTPVDQINARITSLQRIPNRDTSIPRHELGVVASDWTNMLRERIPELAQSLSSVRTMASHSSMVPTLVITPSQTRIDITSTTSGTSISETHVSVSLNGNTGVSPEMEINGAHHSVTPSAEQDPRVSSGPFDLRDLSSSLPNVLGVETPTQNSRTPSGFQSSTPPFDQSPYTTRRERNPESTASGLHLQFIGLLGETFVSTIDWGFLLSLENASLTNNRSMDGFPVN